MPLSEQAVQERGKAKLIPGLSFAAYSDLPGVNATLLLTYAGQSEAEARYEQTHGQDDTIATLRGHASHTAILEPDVFERDYPKPPEFGNLRTKEGREKRDKWNAQHANVITLTADDYEVAVNIRNAVLKDPFVSTLFDGLGMNEVTLKWTDEDTALPCKARIDRLTTWRNYPTLIDLKTTREIGDPEDDDHRVLQRIVAEYSYHVRMAWYLDAVKLYHETLRKPGDTKPIYRTFLVWVLNRPPYLCCATELDDPSLAEGRAEYRKLLRIHAACVKANEWSGYTRGPDDAPTPLGLPAWAFKNRRGG